MPPPVPLPSRRDAVPSRQDMLRLMTRQRPLRRTALADFHSITPALATLASRTTASAPSVHPSDELFGIIIRN